MTKKERIAELEKKVAELEARTPYWYPYWSVILPGSDPNRCDACGAYGTHACYGRWWQNPTWGGTGGATDFTALRNVTYIGATG